MKILYLSKGDHVDYQDDCLCIGLKELFGSDVIDLNKRSHIYSSFSEKTASELYGKGMTVTRVLDDLEVDRTDIGSKIKNKYFDLIVYGSIWRCSDYLEDILKYYPVNKIAVVDGEDESHIHRAYTFGIPYFKRELIYNTSTIHPISFAIPTSKININKNKVRDFAICDPRDISTYIYKTESDYYHGYGESRFAYTMKKAGWDCLRHYEIMANGCIPIFLNVDQCPNLIMVDYPKDLCSLINRTINITSNYEDLYNSYIDSFESSIQKLTTISLATKFINTLI